MNSLHAKMAKGAAWMVLFKLVERSIGLFSVLFLARILVPADFGIVALATATIAILEVLGSFSFDIALIQRKNADSSHYDTAWTFNVIVGISACLIILALAQPAASFYNEPRLRQLLYLLALSPLAGSLENIGIVAFRKDMQFEKEFAFLITKKILTVGLTLVLAISLRSYWALAIGILFGRTAGTLLSYIVSSYRPTLTLARKKELMSFSGWSFANNALYFMSNRSGDFIIGKMSSPAALGIYNLSYEISTLPTTELVAPINRAVFSGYAKMDSVEMKTSYLAILQVISLISIPAALGISAIASVFVPFLLGEKWLESIPIIQILAFYGFIQALQGNVGYVYYALGIPKTVTKYSFYFNLLMIPGFIIGSHYWGPTGAATALIISTAVVTPFNFFNLSKRLNLTTLDFVQAMWRPCISGAIMFIGISFIKVISAPHDITLLYLLLIIFSGFIIYSTCIYLLWITSGQPNSSEKRIYNIIKNKLHAIFKPVETA